MDVICERSQVRSEMTLIYEILKKYGKGPKNVFREAFYFRGPQIFGVHFILGQNFVKK